MSQIRVGILPLYLKLYDNVLGSMRKRINEFNELIKDRLKECNLDLISAPICMERKEFENAVSLFDDACAVITLHLSYSPSLESIDSLVKINKPIIVLDTTPKYSFDQTADNDDILYNHGIHGVQDMCNLLKRRGVQYFVAAGHWENSDVIERVAGLCKAAYAAENMRKSRVGLIGTSFKGMGDFYVAPEELKYSIGIQVVQFDMNKVQYYKELITEEDLQTEMDDDLILFNSEKYDEETHKRTSRMNLLIRRWIEENKIDAFTMNFSDIDRQTGFECVPFVEACKSMARGVGYAGEGDVLTSALCGALLKIYPETSFTEMFCPDWKGSSIFLSHMGEINIRTAKGKMLLRQKEYLYSDVDDPMMITGGFKPGAAVLVNLAPVLDGKYTLILSRVEVLEVERAGKLEDSIHGWIRPEISLSDFLEKYSSAGGTHHLVLVYGDVINNLVAFGKMMNFSVEKI